MRLYTDWIYNCPTRAASLALIRKGVEVHEYLYAHDNVNTAMLADFMADDHNGYENVEKTWGDGTGLRLDGKGKLRWTQLP